MSRRAKESDPPPGEDVFTAADLEDDDAASLRRARIDKVAVVVAVAAVGMWCGGLVALGACAAPFVFERTPYPFSGQAMGAAFARFDYIAVGASIVALLCEVVRTVLSLRRASARSAAARVRRYVAIALAAGALYSATQLTPEIMRLHNDGVRRGQGAEGAELEAIHGRAELIGKAVVPLGILLIGLHVFTLRGGQRDEDEDEDDAVAPLPPGAR